MFYQCPFTSTLRLKNTNHFTKDVSLPYIRTYEGFVAYCFIVFLPEREPSPPSPGAVQPPPIVTNYDPKGAHHQYMIIIIYTHLVSARYFEPCVNDNE